jgi:hypothetical protein
VLWRHDPSAVRARVHESFDDSRHCKVVRFMLPHSNDSPSSLDENRLHLWISEGKPSRFDPYRVERAQIPSQLEARVAPATAE